jgi:hypothetical protein
MYIKKMIPIISLVILSTMTMALTTGIRLANEFHSIGYHYSIHCPADWKITDRGNGVVVFRYKANQSMPMTINIQTIYTKKGGGKYKNVKDLMDDFYSQVPMHTQHATFLERKPIHLTQPDGIMLNGEETTLTFKENGRIDKQWQVMLQNQDGNLFQAFAYRAPVTVFDVYRPVATAMLASLVTN